MDLKSGYPFWAIRNGLMHAFPRLTESARCDVAVVGGGITGAVVADHLARQGFGVMVLEQRDVGWGSTAASTALLQYDLDTNLVDLAVRLGESQAAQAFQATAEAIPRLGAVAAEVRDADFARQDSLYLASRKRDARTLQMECELRARHGFPVEWLDAAALQERFALNSPGGILSRLGARVDPYRLTYRLLMRLERRGHSVFDRTSVASIVPTSRGVTLRTAEGLTVRSNHVVLAAGYAAQRWLTERVALNRSSYAFITDPLDAEALGFLARTMIWESARPYLYMRTTTEGRLLVGGEDDAVDLPARRDRRVERKAHILARKTMKLLPWLSFQPAFSWAGTFAETEDGLPWFGTHPDFGPRVHWALAYGGNGIPFSVVAADLVLASIRRQPHPLAAMMSFRRLGGMNRRS